VQDFIAADMLANQLV